MAYTQLTYMAPRSRIDTVRDTSRSTLSTGWLNSVKAVGKVSDPICEGQLLLPAHMWPTAFCQSPAWVCKSYASEVNIFINGQRNFLDERQCNFNTHGAKSCIIWPWILSWTTIGGGGDHHSGAKWANWIKDLDIRVIISKEFFLLYAPVYHHRGFGCTYIKRHVIICNFDLTRNN